jgi:predicted nuclease of restriction endonuclease-like (RecB) superfamily
MTILDEVGGMEDNKDLLSYAEAAQKIKNAILQSRYRAAANANAEHLNLYYGVGKYISANTRSGKWGAGTIEMISEQLQGELPGFSPTNMKNMRVFFEQWASEFEPNRQLPTADLPMSIACDDDSLIRQLPIAELGEMKVLAFCRVGFTHHREILRKCKTSDERWYYILRCADEFWSVQSLKNHLAADEFVAYGSLPNNFSLTIPDEKTAAVAVRSFKNEYLSDFADIKESDDYVERDVENAIVSNVKKFIMTVGDGFAFIGNQHRLIVDDEGSSSTYSSLTGIYRTNAEFHRNESSDSHVFLCAGCFILGYPERSRHTDYRKQGFFRYRGTSGNV